MTNTQKTGLQKVLHTLMYLIIVAIVVGVLVYLSTHPDPRPYIPNDADHKGVLDWKTCLDCHGKDGASPLSPEHPINGERCFRCHEYAPDTTQNQEKTP